MNKEKDRLTIEKEHLSNERAQLEKAVYVTCQEVSKITKDMNVLVLQLLPQIFLILGPLLFLFEGTLTLVSQLG